MGAGEWSSAAKFFPAVCGGVSDRIWDTVLSYAEKRDRESYFSGCAQKGCPLSRGAGVLGQREPAPRSLYRAGGQYFKPRKGGDLF